MTALTEARKNYAESIIREDRGRSIRHYYYVGEMEHQEWYPKETVGYHRMQRDISALRLDKRIAYDDIDDESREILDWATPGFASLGEFLQQQLSALSDGFSLEFWKGRIVPVIFLEKDTLLSIVAEPCREFRAIWTSGKGDSSWTLWNKLARLLEDGEFEAATIYTFTDLDPKGEGSIVEAIDNLRRPGKHWDPKKRRWRPGFRCLTPYTRLRSALTKEQVKQFRLPNRKIEGGKVATRDATEIDALKSPDLQRLVRRCLDDHLDRHGYRSAWDRLQADEAIANAKAIALGKRLAKRYGKVQS